VLSLPLKLSLRLLKPTSTALLLLFGQLFRREIKIVATICQIFRLKCIKFDFDWGFAPDPLGELIALPQRPPSWI